jgi:hypothetical protein
VYSVLPGPLGAAAEELTPILRAGAIAMIAAGLSWIVKPERKLKEQRTTPIACKEVR